MRSENDSLGRAQSAGQSPKEAYQYSDAVVVGSVKKVESDGEVNRVQVTVTNSYTGVKQKELTVLENAA